MRENYFIDFLRFIFSLCILFYHSWIFAGTFGNGILNHGYLAVDFYFIVTGYLMINSSRKNKSNDTTILKDSFIFIYKKIKNIFPALLVTFLFGVLLVYGKNIIFSPSILLSNTLLPELLQLSILGYDLTVNSSWWYISAMLLVLALLYPIAKKYSDDYSRYIAPLIIIFTLGFINMHAININDPVRIDYFLRNGFYKALIFIPLGNISYIVTKKIKEIDFKKYTLIVLSIIEILLYTILILNMHYFFMGTFLFALLLMLNISLTFSGITFLSKMFKNNIWKKLGNYGFYIFLCNISVRTYIQRNYLNLGFSYNELLFRFIINSCLLALILYIIVEIIYMKFILKKLSDYSKRKWKK